MTGRKRFVVLLVALGACKDPAPQYPAVIPPEIVEACALTERKCTACHEPERFMDARHTPERWRGIVDQMRRFPSSGISPAEGDIIVKCLVFRSSATSSVHTATQTMVAHGPSWVTSFGEVQALHFDLHDRLHITAIRSRNPLEP